MKRSWHTLQLVDALHSSVVDGSTLLSGLSTAVAQCYSFQLPWICTARHSWVGTAGWQPQLVWDTERKTEGLVHTNMRKTIASVGECEENGNLNTRDSKRHRCLVKVLLPLASVSFTHQYCSEHFESKILRQNFCVFCVLTATSPSPSGLWLSTSDAFTLGLP